MGAHQRAGRWKRLAVQLKLDAEEQRTFGPGKQAAEVERLPGIRFEDGTLHQAVERVTGVAPRDSGLREIRPDERALLWVGKKVSNGPIDVSFERVRHGALRRE